MDKGHDWTVEGDLAGDGHVTKGRVVREKCTLVGMKYFVKGRG